MKLTKIEFNRHVLYDRNVIFQNNLNRSLWVYMSSKLEIKIDPLYLNLLQGDLFPTIAKNLRDENWK